ncbi:MAG: hypothetical protein QOC94_2528 [Actinoplanes sp.]|nr:hypothetical protein [Actinoplanes sp.]
MSEWEPATDAEVAMRDALRTDDQESYFRILAGVDLLLPVSADALAGLAPLGWGTWSTGGRTHVLAFTSPSALQACLADYTGSARRVAYGELADTWPNLEWWLAVNPGLPIEGYLPAWFVAQLSRGDLRLPKRGPAREAGQTGSKFQDLQAAAVAANAAGVGASDYPGNAYRASGYGFGATAAATPGNYNAFGQDEPASQPGDGDSGQPPRNDFEQSSGSGATGSGATGSGAMGSRAMGSGVAPGSGGPGSGYPFAQAPGPGEVGPGGLPLRAPGAILPTGLPSRRPPGSPAEAQPSPAVPQAQGGAPGPAVPQAQGGSPAKAAADGDAGGGPGGPLRVPGAAAAAAFGARPGGTAAGKAGGLPPVQDPRVSLPTRTPTAQNPPVPPHLAPAASGTVESTTTPAAAPQASGIGGALPRRQVLPPSERPPSMAAAAQALAGNRTSPQPAPEPTVDGEPTRQGLVPPVVPGEGSHPRRGGALSAPGGGVAASGRGLGVSADGVVAAEAARGAEPSTSPTSFGRQDSAAPASPGELESAAGSSPTGSDLPAGSTATVADRPGGARGSGPAAAGAGAPYVPAPYVPAPYVPAPSIRPTIPATVAAAVPTPAFDEDEFVPANTVERDLFDAAGDRSTDAFLSTLLLATVLLPVAPDSRPGSAPGESGFVFRTEEIDGDSFLVVFTSPDRLAEYFAEPTRTVGVRFVDLIRNWPDPAWSFAVNPDTAVGAKYPGPQVIALASWAAESGLGLDPADGPAAIESTQAAVPPPQPTTDSTQHATVMQKAVSAEQVDYFLDRGYDRVAGFVHRAGEVEHLRTPAELSAALGLGYDGSPYQADAKEVFVLRWPAFRPSLYRIPYGGQNEQALRAMDGWVIERAPFRGNGFAPGEGRDVIAEFKVDSVRLPHGAQLWRLDADGTEKMIAVLDSDAPVWRRVGEQ